MAVTLTFTEDTVFTVLGNLLVQMVPTGTSIVRAQINRVPEPAEKNFVLMTQIQRTRLSTNVDDTVDVLVAGYIAGTTLTITSVIQNAIVIGSGVSGPGVLFGTNITAFGTGTGGVGTYTISQSQYVGAMVDPFTNELTGDFGAGQPTPITLYCGYKSAQQCAQFDMQVDVHGPACLDTVEIISTLFRDEFSTTYFDACGYPMQALYASDPRQVPFINGEDQWEDRWTLDLSLEVDQAVIISQQFAQNLLVDLINVDVVYPP